MVSFNESIKSATRISSLYSFSSVITGVTSVEQLENNVKASDWVLTEADMEEIEAAGREAQAARA